MIYTLKPDVQGYLIIRGTYKPGDVIQLSGNFKSVAVYDLFGAVGNPVKITNVPNEICTIGDIAWSGGSWAEGIIFRNCKYIELFGSSKNNFKIIGSNSTKTDGNGNLVRSAYFDLRIDELSDNFKVHDLTIQNGGTGIWAKTEVSQTNSKTWFPNTYLENFEFYNLEISNTANEGMYIGHTATWWNITTNQPLYTTPPADSGSYIKQPIKLRSVKIYNNVLHDIGVDGIQAAAIDNLSISGNEVYNWALKKEGPQSGGICIGGRVKDFVVENNVVHDGWGEMLQVFADAGVAIVRNNLFVKNVLSGVMLRGGAGLLVQFTNNTIVQPGEVAIRVNGSTGSRAAHVIKNNLFVQPGSGGRVFYLENGGAISDLDNKVFSLLPQALLSNDGKYIPLSASTAKGYGYTPTTVPSEPPVEPTKVIIELTGELADFVKTIGPGRHEGMIKIGDLNVKIGIDITK